MVTFLICAGGPDPSRPDPASATQPDPARRQFSFNISFLLFSTAAVHRCLQLQSILLSILPSIHRVVAMRAVGGSGFGVGAGDVMAAVMGGSSSSSSSSSSVPILVQGNQHGPFATMTSGTGVLVSEMMRTIPTRIFDQWLKKPTGKIFGFVLRPPRRNARVRPVRTAGARPRYDSTNLANPKPRIRGDVRSPRNACPVAAPSYTNTSCHLVRRDKESSLHAVTEKVCSCGDLR